MRISSCFVSVMITILLALSSISDAQSPTEAVVAGCPCRATVETTLLSGVSVFQLRGSLLEKRATLRAKGIPPRSLRANGTVKVHIVTNAGGKVVCASAVTGHPLLRSPAETAAKKWRFAPVNADGQPVALEGEIPVAFEN